jgi:hypothetical protein
VDDAEVDTVVVCVTNMVTLVDDLIVGERERVVVGEEVETTEEVDDIVGFCEFVTDSVRVVVRVEDRVEVIEIVGECEED